MPEPRQPDRQTSELLGRLRSFCFPQGESCVEGVRGIQMTERGEIRTSIDGRWTPFTATEFVDATSTNFRWEARVGGKITQVRVVDKFEERHGSLEILLAGLLPINKVQGPLLDQGELQRYLANVLLCPPILLHHRGLEWSSPGANRLRVRDVQDEAGSTVEFEIAEDGRPLACYADRPRMEGKRILVTPWSGTCTEFAEREGFRAGYRLEVSWHLGERIFTYFRVEVLTSSVLR